MLRSYFLTLLLSFTAFFLQAQNWIPMGTAVQIIEECDTCFQLTEELNNQAGCVWNQQTYDFSSDLVIEFTMNFGDNNNDGADGMSMILATAPNQCGGSGEELGAGGLDNTVIYEFDSFTNPGPYDDPGLCQDHVGMYLDGDLTNTIEGPECFGNFPFYDNIEDGDFHDVRFIWNAGLNFFEIEFDGDIVLDGTFDITAHLGINDVFVGFGGGTGGLSNVQVVCPGLTIEAPQLPILLEVEDEVCANGEGIFVFDSQGELLTWTFPVGSTIDFVNDTVVITFGDVSGEVCVYSMNNCGQSDMVCHMVEVVQAPDVTPVEPPIVCDSIFTLTDIELIGLTTETVDYYYSETDAEEETNVIITPFEIDEDATIWIRVENALGCFTIYSLDVLFGNIEPMIDPDTTNRICEGEEFDLSTVSYSDINGNVIDNISWHETQSNAEDGIDEIAETVSSNGEFWARLTSLDGCIGIISVSVEVLSLPILEFLDDELDCTDTSYQLDATTDQNVVWDWSGPNSFASSEENPTITETGMYFVTVTDINGCTSEASAEISGSVDLPDVTVSAEELNCTNDSLFFDVEPIDLSYQYEWTGPNSYSANIAEALYTEGGMYELTITTPESCELIISVEVIANNEGFENVLIDLVNPDCFQSFGSLEVLNFDGGNGLILYSIDGGTTFQESPFFDNLDPGTYNLVLEDVAGCFYTELLEIQGHEMGQVDLIDEIQISQGDSALVDVITNILPENVVTAQWSPSDLVSCDTCLSTFVLPPVTTLFQFSLEDENGCIYQEEVLVIVELANEGGLYVPNVFSPNDDALNDRFYVLSSAESNRIIEEISVFDRWGQRVFYAQNIPVNDPMYGWDGYFKGELLGPEVFTYLIRIANMDETEYFTGDLTLLR